MTNSFIHLDKINFITEPSIDFIERLQYICDLVLKTTKIIRIDLRDEHVSYCLSNKNFMFR